MGKPRETSSSSTLATAPMSRRRMSALPHTMGSNVSGTERRMFARFGVRLEKRTAPPYAVLIPEITLEFAGQVFTFS